MKILVVTASSDRPEAALFCGLAKSGHEIKLLGTPQPHFKEQFLQHGISVEEFSCKSRFDFKAASALGKQIESFKPNIVHAFTGRTLAAAVRNKKKNSNFKLLTYRGTVGHLSRFDPGSTCSFLSSKVDGISCVSHAVGQYLRSKKVAAEKLATIYKGHNVEWYQAKSAITKTDLGIPNSDFVVVCVANARPVKGVDVFIKAANLLNTDISFLIIGDIRVSGLRDLARNPKIKFLGYRKDAQEIVALCDLVVIPSRGREGLPKALLEAFAMKKAVIASKVGGIPEVIRNEKEGLLIPPEDPKLLAHAISFLHSNSSLTEKFSESGYLRLINDFTVDQMVSATEKFYERVLSGF